jgi:hypothetical protein
LNAELGAVQICRVIWQAHFSSGRVFRCKRTRPQKELTPEKPFLRVAGVVAVVGVEARGPFLVGELDGTLDEPLERAVVHGRLKEAGCMRIKMHSRICNVLLLLPLRRRRSEQLLLDLDRHQVATKDDVVNPTIRLGLAEAHNRSRVALGILDKVAELVLETGRVILARLESSLAHLSKRLRVGVKR